jgi:hypothetical protein
MASRNLEPFTPLPQALGAKLRLNVGEMQSTLSMFSLLHQDATDRIPLLELVSIHHPSYRVISAIKKCTQAITRSLETLLLSYPSGGATAHPPAAFIFSPNRTSARPSLRSDLTISFLGSVMADAHALRRAWDLSGHWAAVSESFTNPSLDQSVWTGLWT